jgi:signal peptidase I
VRRNKAATAAVKKGAAPPPTAKDRSNRGFIAEWTVTVILLLFGTTNLVQAFVIPTGSMQDTLLIGDHLLVDKLAYAPPGPISKHLLPYEEIKRGDIIVFRSPADLNTTLVKRCMGVPGDRIKLVDKQVYLNGRKLNEPYVLHSTDYINDYRDNFPRDPDMQVSEHGREMLEHNVANGEVVVPPDHYFAMGDNRDNSLDSRYWGFVPRENITGKPFIVYWSYDAPTEALLNPTIGADHLVDLMEHFFTKTRWRRTFMLVHGVTIN